jgi:erythromycin esterase-like protein
LPVEAREGCVVGVGEPNHGTAEVSELRRSMILAASTSRRTVVALEAPTDTTVPLSEYVSGSIPWHDDLLRAVASWPWRTKETRRLLAALRQLNASGDGSVRVVGIDPQVPVRAARSLFAAARRLGHPQAALSLAFAPLRVGMPPPRRVRAPMLKLLDEVEGRRSLAPDEVTALREAYALSTHPDGPAHCLARRDRIMAGRVLSCVDEDTLVLALAHNAHVSKTSYAAGVPAMGQHLARALGARYSATGVFTAAGSFRARLGVAGVTSPVDVTLRLPSPPPGSVERAMQEATTTGPGQASTFVVDTTWESLRWAKHAGVVVNPLTWPFAFDAVDMPAAFDAAALIGHASPTHALRR